MDPSPTPFNPDTHIALTYGNWYMAAIRKVNKSGVSNKVGILCILFVVHVDRLVNENMDVRECVIKDRLRIIDYLQHHDPELYFSYTCRLPPNFENI